MSALSDAARGALRNKALGFVYQFHHLLPEFTALENVDVAGAAQRPKTSVQARLASMRRPCSNRWALGIASSIKPGELSGGERQRAAVARALVNRRRHASWATSPPAISMKRPPPRCSS